MNIDISELKTNVRKEQARLLRDFAAALQMQVNEVMAEAEKLDPSPVQPAKSAGGRKRTASNGRRVTSGGAVPLLSAVEDFIRGCDRAVRLGDIVESGGYDRSRTIVLIRQLVSEGKVALDGKAYRWCAPREHPMEPAQANRPPGAWVYRSESVPTE